MSGEVYDVVIVGSGAGGAASAWAHTTAGLKVLLLEAGPRFDPSQDYPLTEPGWERRTFPVKSGSRARILYGDLGRLDPANADLQSWNAVQGKRPLNARRQPSRSGYSHVMGVGGSTLHYVGEAHRLHPKSFKLARDHGIGADWPLEYQELEPYYTTAEYLIGVAGPEADGARWRSAPYPQSAHPLSPAARRLSEAGQRIGLPFEPNARAALSQPFYGRPGCNYCGQCSRGCPLGDKGSTDVTFLRHAEVTGRLKLIPEARVINIEAARDGRIAAVHYVHEKRRIRQETPQLILACGAVQTPRLLLASHSTQTPDGLANGSGQVGRNFMETLSWHSTALLPGLRNSHMGLPADAIAWSQSAPDGAPGALGGCRYTSAVQEIGLTGPVAYASRLLSGFGAAFKTRLRSSFGSAITVGATGAVIPDARSYIALSDNENDSDGLPLPVINSVLSSNSLKLLQNMASNARELLRQTGTEMIVEEFGSWDEFTATHVFGTARMGADSATSVTDRFGRSHDHPNLWIADASVFPSSGGGEGPSLTIQALALRQAERITG
ncbi:Choline dehydrogenase [Roseovarius tolerans]|uniref:Choline dehydrogenase n=1 Tax=Roseovarius tolerans TaxID=74031 RepID=A0A1H7WJG9_9RHOB|nr:GMC family oxidoreductase [Roseovarius tolerans]SEM21706.1 Choline dehydrogenase [Roseovarius tolerans]